MCGIAGFFMRAAPHGAEATLDAMSAAVAHRGSDGAGRWTSADLRHGLAHRRLAVVDPEGGAQPMTSGDGRYVIVFNGEIYNHAELRGALEGDGERLRTRSDTEVLLAGYARWGAGVLPRLRGMFAFAVLDTREDRLFLARDPTGIKPLYYADSAFGLYFGSEPKAVLAAAEVPRRLDHAALRDFFVLGYPLSPRTAFRDVAELGAGAWLERTASDTRQGVFWRWARDEEPIDAEEGEARVKGALLDSLADHLVADVPIGAFLSGGIDSSLLVALVTRELGRPLQTFTVGFEDRTHDESEHARRVARHLGTEHHEIRLHSGAGNLELLYAVLAQFDQPFGDSSAIPTWQICREIRQHVKVAISGDGADELFGGYRRFWYADLARGLGRVPRFGLEGLRAAARGARRLAPDASRQSGRLLGAAAAPGAERFLALSAYWGRAELAGMLRPAALRAVADTAGAELPGGPSGAAGGQEFVDFTVRHALPGDYLRKVDVASGAHALEVRVPMLGAQVLDVARRLPARLRYTRQEPKLLLRRLAGRYLPEAVIRRPKAGFSIPFDTWLGAAGRAAVRDDLLRPGAPLHELVDPAYTRRLLGAFVGGAWDRAELSRYQVSQRVYMLLSLGRWLDRWRPAP